MHMLESMEGDSGIFSYARQWPLARRAVPYAVAGPFSHATDSQAYQRFANTATSTFAITMEVFTVWIGFVVWVVLPGFPGNSPL